MLTLKRNINFVEQVVNQVCVHAFSLVSDSTIFSLSVEQNAAKKREQEQGEGGGPAPPCKIARTDSQEMNEDS